MAVLLQASKASQKNRLLFAQLLRRHFVSKIKKIMIRLVHVCMQYSLAITKMNVLKIIINKNNFTIISIQFLRNDKIYIVFLYKKLSISQTHNKVLHSSISFTRSEEISLCRSIVFSDTKYKLYRA